MKITVETLEAAGATCSGLDWFRAAYPNGFKGEWTIELQMEILRSEGRGWLGWAWHNKLVPMWSMYGADLSEADLRGADLRGADLRGADLRGADLRGANLYRANLYGADLSGADLSWANLYGVDLSWADLSGADLYGVDLSWADLYGANPSGANLSGANYNKYTIWPEGFKFPKGE